MEAGCSQEISRRSLRRHRDNEEGRRPTDSPPTDRWAMTARPSTGSVGYSHPPCYGPLWGRLSGGAMLLIPLLVPVEGGG